LFADEMMAIFDNSMENRVIGAPGRYDKRQIISINEPEAEFGTEHA